MIRDNLGVDMDSSKEACDLLSSNPEALASLLLFVAIREARIYKWEKSKQAGHDLGQQEVLKWFNDNWAAWYRDHWVSHLKGKEFWKEFGNEEYNVANNAPDNCLFNEIMKSVADHGENLGIILWATKSGQDMEQVLSVLRKVNINSHRFIIEEKSLIALTKALDEADKYKWIASEKAGRDLGDQAIMEWFRNSWPTFYKEFLDSVPKN